MTPFCIANWKMHKTQAQALDFVAALAAADITGVAVAIAASSPLLSVLQTALAHTPIQLVAQNMHDQPEGAFTGEVSATQLKDVGCNGVIVGHSERRQLFGESQEFITQKLHAAIKHGLQPIYCVGESYEDRAADRTNAVLTTQLEQAITGLSAEAVESVIIAYEPIWAIGTGQTATAADIAAVHQMLRRQLPADTPIIYGGSVQPDNAVELATVDQLAGFLVGGASLDPQQFIQIIAALRPA